MVGEVWHSTDWQPGMMASHHQCWKHRQLWSYLGEMSEHKKCGAGGHEMDCGLLTRHTRSSSAWWCSGWSSPRSRSWLCPAPATGSELLISNTGGQAEDCKTKHIEWRVQIASLTAALDTPPRLPSDTRQHSTLLESYKWEQKFVDHFICSVSELLCWVGLSIRWWRSCCGGGWVGGDSLR